MDGKQLKDIKGEKINGSKNRKNTYIKALDNDEVIWLRSLMQNPFYTSVEEDPIDRKMRKQFFNALREVNESDN